MARFTLTNNDWVVTFMIVCTMLREADLSDGTIYCYPGTLLVNGKGGEDDRCDPCAEGYFIEHLSHRQTFCEACTLINYHSPHFKLVASCTPHSDTKIKCRSPRYFFSHESRSCVPCRDCIAEGLHLGLACSDYKNSVCCPREGMAVNNNNCMEVVHCGTGQYLNSKYGFSNETCASCPEGFTNYAPVHRMQTCKNNCIVVRPDEPSSLVERRVRCKPGECEMGRSCAVEDGVVCAPCSSRPTKSPIRETTLNNLKEEEEKQAQLQGESKINNKTRDGTLEVFKLLGIVFGLVLFTACGILLPHNLQNLTFKKEITSPF